MPLSPNITRALLCALPFEAGPLIKALALKKTDDNEGFTTFIGNGFALVVTGMGGIAASAATNFTMGRFPDVNTIYNIGICGARSEYKIGQLILPTKIVIEAPFSQYYPENLIGGEFIKGTLGSFLAPVRAGIDSIDFYDMEGGFIFREGTRYLPPSRIMLLKIVSDNLTQLPTSKAFITSLVEAKISELQEIIELQESSVFKMVNSLNKEEVVFLNELSLKMRLTKTQERQLLSAAQELKVRGGDIRSLEAIKTPNFTDTKLRELWLYEALQILQRV
jgi:hypothetical protein